MLNTRLRKLLEWHFYNYEADKKLTEEKAEDITYSGLTVNPTPSIGHGNKTSNPTEFKAEKLFELGGDWAAVVRNTFNAFKFEPEYDVMVDLYMKKIEFYKIIKSDKNKYGLSRRTFFRWRNHWLEIALLWAQEFRLL